MPIRRRPHSLPAELIVSVTSYRPRFPGLATALKSILRQTIKADRTILWIDHTDLEFIPRNVLDLEDRGLEIKSVKTPMRSYAKIIPALQRFPDAFLVTADDDLRYRPDWLERLVAEYQGLNEVICHRAHQIRVGVGNMPGPYPTWEKEIGARDPSPLIFATGVGGVLYPPKILHPDVTDVETFKSLCPIEDDVWLYWMARRNGIMAHKIGPRFNFDYIEGSQDVALHHQNVGEKKNDIQIAAMIARYGSPL